MSGQDVSGQEPTFSTSGVHTGDLRPGEWVTLTDRKGRRNLVRLEAGGMFHTTKGGVAHDDLIGGPEGVVVRSVGGLNFLAMRPLLHDHIVTMKRGAAIIYPKEAAQILMMGDIFPGARVLEAGVGSGGLTLALLRTLGADGELHSIERRQDFADIARRNVEEFHGGPHPAWHLQVGDLNEVLADPRRRPEQVDRVILDMLAPWDCIEHVGEVLAPGGVLVCYVATTTQMGLVMDTIRTHQGFTEPEATESIQRDWHAEGLAIRPSHGGVGHTGFLVIARRLAPGVTTPPRKRRPAPGAYGPDYHGPRPPGVDEASKPSE
ncbi:tRNA (adenine57-N1/adenine58-N1)-methyltransferase [Propioniferax innocua]|uniref:tRNA (adenine(58)-N(1))-methyltransferase TrmI n=1 Tax=Propioniferax innocua TaxID=1753 RepID=A0A542ZPN3_9ACTN|nr:tRNA (adenine57-N1/adenine58-N1)-methyltransferase [Propioniferax innocua]